MSSTDSIVRSIVIKAPRSRVWQALTDHERFSAWFTVDMPEPFRAGEPSRGTVGHGKFKGVPFEVVIDRIEPENFFSWHWHPFAVEPNIDYSEEQKTRVAFELSEVAEGTRVTVTETGFDKLPKHRYAPAFRANGEGWSIQVENIRDYVEKKAA